MKSAVRFALVAAVVAAAALATESASAQEVGVRYYMSDMGFNSGWERPYASGRIPTPPYFAIHPPVYYSYPVPRTYGYTPWAYPSYVMTPTIKAPAQPAMYENPHVKQEAAPPAKTKSASHTNRAPQAIENPYVQATIRSASVAVDVR